MRMANNAEWKCICGFSNTVELTECGRCGQSLTFDEAYFAENESSPSIRQFDTPEWQCPKCTFLNHDRDICEACCNIKEVNDKVEDGTLCTKELDYLDKELRIILVGRTGAGKSATGNTILGSQTLLSEVSSSSITKNCHRSQVEKNGRLVQVIDTPGLFDTEMNNDEVTKEVLKCVGLSAPGPHAILLVVGMGRFTEEEKETVRLLQKVFGDNMTKYLIVVFTRKDDLDHGKKTVHDMVREAPSSIQKFLAECDNRYYAIDNNADSATREKQTDELLEMIDAVVKKNGGDFYKSKIFNETDSVIRKRILQKNNEQKDKMARLHRQISEEYHDHIQLAKTREVSLTEQLSILEDEHVKENTKCLQLQERISTLIDSAQECVMHYEQKNRIAELKERILNVKKELHEIQRGKSVASETVLARKQEVIQYSQRWNPREEVREEIERGDANILKEVWKSICSTGGQILERFKSLFEILKDRARFQ